LGRRIRKHLVDGALQRGEVLVDDAPNGQWVNIAKVIVDENVAETT
jgi:hypothetical protein